MLRGIDHIVILVADLDQARADYTALGFTVVPGGEHTGGATHNALVAFADGSYLELIAFKRTEPGHRWWRWVDLGGGIVDFALLPSDIGADIEAARAHGVDYEGPAPGGRLRPDGLAVEWRLGLPPTPDLPFMCYDVTPRERRVPHGDAWQHANGAQGVSNITVAVADLAASIARYRGLLGTEPVEASVSLPDARAAVFHVGPAAITLAQPATETSPLRAHLAARGDGPYALTLRPLSGASPAPLDPALSHSARLMWG